MSEQVPKVDEQFEIHWAQKVDKQAPSEAQEGDNAPPLAPNSKMAEGAAPEPNEGSDEIGSDSKVTSGVEDSGQRYLFFTFSFNFESNLHKFYVCSCFVVSKQTGVRRQIRHRFLPLPRDAPRRQCRLQSKFLQRA